MTLQGFESTDIREGKNENLNYTKSRNCFEFQDAKCIFSELQFHFYFKHVKPMSLKFIINDGSRETYLSYSSQ